MESCYEMIFLVSEREVKRTRKRWAKHSKAFLTNKFNWMLIYAP